MKLSSVNVVLTHQNSFFLHILIKCLFLNSRNLHSCGKDRQMTSKDNEFKKKSKEWRIVIGGRMGNSGGEGFLERTVNTI